MGSTSDPPRAVETTLSWLVTVNRDTPLVPTRPGHAIEGIEVGHSFGSRPALDGVSLTVARGEIHALLGPNGAGKTTLLRVLSGLIKPRLGRVTVAGVDVVADPEGVRERIGLLPSGEYTLYDRISGLENLVFFGRLQGLRRRDARARATDLLEAVGLAESAGFPAGRYSHGMKKRLSFARALLIDPEVLLIDEATHDLDPEGGSRIRDLARTAAAGGAAVLWTTQRLDEIRGFAARVTLLQRGRTRFQGSLLELVARAPRRYVLHVRNGSTPSDMLEPVLARALEPMPAVELSRAVDLEHFVLALGDGAVLGDALTALAAADVQVLECREERSAVEEAFLRVTREDAE
jgi:ABC-2 type transport system ATP-binding protein